MDYVSEIMDHLKTPHTRRSSDQKKPPKPITNIIGVQNKRDWCTALRKLYVILLLFTAVKT